MMFTIGAFCFGTVCYYDDHLTLNGIGEAGVDTHKTMQSDPLCLSAKRFMWSFSIDYGFLGRSHRLTQID